MALWDRFDLERVSAVVVSHEHPDHCLDLLAAYHALAYGPTRYPAIPLYCPREVTERVRGFVQAGAGHAIDQVFDFRSVEDGDRVQAGEVTIDFRRTDHSVPTVGSRFEAGGKVLAYSADTGAGGDWGALADEADLFLCEASYQGEPSAEGYTKHLTAAEAGMIARERGSRRLMLTHIPAHLDVSTSVDEAETTFDRPVALALPGTVHEL